MTFIVEKLTQIYQDCFFAPTYIHLGTGLANGGNFCNFQAGYVGEDVESILHKLLAVCLALFFLTNNLIHQGTCSF